MKAIAYCRVSTEGQGRSGLGLEAQRHIISEYARDNGYEIAKTVTEIKSGSDDDRQGLADAIAWAEANNGVVLVAKLDRLSRNMHFISALMHHGKPVVPCDMPEDTPTFMLHVQAAFAEEERKRISDRTKAALAAKKAAGVRLGTPNPKAGAKASAIARKQKAFRRAEKLRKPIMAALRTKPESLTAMTRLLDDMGCLSPTGKPISKAAVMRTMQRLEIRKPEAWA